MDFAIENYPSYVLSDGTYRVAKLNNTTKRPVLVANFNKALMALTKETKVEKAQEIVASVGAPSHSYDVVLGRLMMTTESYDHYANINGFRKLKVNNIVNTKVSNVYNSVPKEERKQEENVMAVNDYTKEPEIKQELPNMVSSMPSFVPEDKKEYEVKIEKNDDNSLTNNTRSSRLEQRDDIYSSINDVINTPERFKENNVSEIQNRVRESLASQDDFYGTHNEKVSNFSSRSERNYGIEEKNPYSESVNSLVNDGGNAYKGELVVGRDRETLDKIDRITDKNNITIHNTAEDLQAAYDKFSDSEKNKKEAIDKLLQLEKQYKEMKEKREKQLAKRAEKIADLNSKTEENEKEISDYTFHSDELGRKIAELMKNMREDSFDYEETSYGMRR